MPTLLTPKASLFDAFKIFLTLVLPVTLVNVALYYLGVAINALSDNNITPNGQPINLASVIIASIVGSILCLLIYLVIRALAKRPGKWIQLIGFGLLLLSFINPFSVENATLLTILVLNAMHVVVALPLIRAFARLSRDALLKGTKAV